MTIDDFINKAYLKDKTVLKVLFEQHRQEVADKERTKIVNEIRQMYSMDEPGAPYSYHSAADSIARKIENKSEESCTCKMVGGPTTDGEGGAFCTNCNRSV